MKILISNDDGIYAQGINALANALSTIGEVTVVAPDRNRSGASNSITLETPLRVLELKENFYAVQGTPADCVHYALNELLKDDQPDLVVTGINHGANLGDDTLYSGTVASAMEAFFMDIPAIALSLVGKNHFDTAVKVACQLVKQHQQSELPSHLINVNIPDVAFDELNGIEITKLGTRHHGGNMFVEPDPRGNMMYWLGMVGKSKDNEAGTDFYAISQNRVSITPLQVDLTDHSALNSMKNWLI